MRTAQDGAGDLLIGLFGLSGIEVARKRRRAAGLRLPSETRRGEDAVQALAQRVVSLGGTPRVARGRLSEARPHLPALAIGDEGELLLLTEVTRGSVTAWESGSERRLSLAEAERRLGSDVVDFLSVDDPAPLSALAAHGDEHPSPLQRLFALATLERRDLTIVLVYAAAIGVLSLAVPVTVQALVSSVAALGLLTPIVVLAAILFGVLALAAVLRALSAWVVERLQQRLFVRVAEDLVHRFTHAKLEALSKGSAGDMANRFFEVLVLQKGAQSLLLDGAGVALQVVVGAVLLAVYHPLLLGFGLAVVVLLLALLFVTGRGAVTTSLAESKQKYRVAAWIDEVARHPGAFRSRSSGAFARACTEELVRSYLVERRAHFRHVFRQNLVALGMQAVVTSALFGVGGWLASTGRISLGQLVAAEIVLASVVGGFAKLGKHLEVLYDLMTASAKLGHLVDLPQPEGAGILPVPGDGAVGLDALGVSYGHSEGGGVRGVSLSVQPGEIVAIVGPNGAGKSTLLDLLGGLRAPKEGRVLVAGADERGLDPELLREAVVVLRREPLFEGTLADNVAVGRADVGPEEVRAALVATGLADAVSAFPLAELTEMGPSGAPLSPGQCRALLVARALAGRPRAILVDGLVDDLDQETQDTLLASLRTARASTVVVATSDARLGERCDRAIRLHHGRLEAAS